MFNLSDKQKELIRQAKETFKDAKRSAPLRSERSVNKQTSEVAPSPRKP